MRYTECMTNTTNIDRATRNVSAFSSYADLLHSITAHGYVPTLVANGDLRHAMDVAALRKFLTAAGHAVFPAQLPEAPKVTTTKAGTPYTVKRTSWRATDADWEYEVTITMGDKTYTDYAYRTDSDSGRSVLGWWALGPGLLPTLGDLVRHFAECCEAQ